MASWQVPEHIANGYFSTVRFVDLSYRGIKPSPRELSDPGCAAAWKFTAGGTTGISHEESDFERLNPDYIPD